MPSPTDRLDALGADALGAAALERAEALGVSTCEVRVEAIRTQYVGLRDAALETTADDLELGMGVRVLHDGAIGFAGSVELSAQAAAGLVELALDAARRTRRLALEPAALAEEPAHGEIAWASACRIDPTEIPLGEKVARLVEWSERLLGHPVVDHVQASFSATAEEKYYADLSGTVARQRRVRVHPVVEE